MPPGFNNLQTRVGVADPGGAATVIYVDGQAPVFTVPVRRVLLSKNFAQECPPGWPAPPDQTGGAAGLWCPRTIASGTTITAYANVAAAIVAAGAGTYA